MLWGSWTLCYYKRVAEHADPNSLLFQENKHTHKETDILQIIITHKTKYLKCVYYEKTIDATLSNNRDQPIKQCYIPDTILPS